MTKKQRSARARRAGAARRKATAVKAFLKKMNPGMKGTVGAVLRKLKGGGYSVIPVKATKNPSKRKLTPYKKLMLRAPKFGKRKYKRFGGT